jgi:hypothetical protein
MPNYVDSPNNPAVLAQEGTPVYLFGSYNMHQANTKMWVTNSALTSNVATITVQIIEGEIPLVGSLITVTQTQAGSGGMNVNRATITAVTINSLTGAGTITYADTHANITSVADSGTAIAEVQEIPETVANGNSIACIFQAPKGDSQFTIPLAVTFPTIPTAATVNLQMALHNVNSEFTNVATTPQIVVASGAITPGSGPVVQVTLQRGYFYRLAVSGVSGTGTIVGKIGG